MAFHEIRIDRSKALPEEPGTGHNRWHPDIPPILECEPGDAVTIETRDTLDGQLTMDSTHADVGQSDLGVAHPLTGPIAVSGAEPGDLLVVDVREIIPDEFGFTAIIPGFGFLRDEFTEPFLARWEIAEGFAVSPEIPGVRLPGAPFMGVLGVAPSAEHFAAISRREAALADRGGMVPLPDAARAVPSDPKIASEALRTIPAREVGGNIDIKQLSAGARVLMPVSTEGAMFSIGDAHFAQGDGETCGCAVEMAATVHVQFDLRKGVARERGIIDLQFERSDYSLPPNYAAPERFFATTGVSVDQDGTNHSEDVTVATRNALRNMIDHLVAEYGYTRTQAYALCSVAVDFKVSQIVNAPNMLVSAFLPLDIFEQ